MARHYAEDIATGAGGSRKLAIGGRPGPGQSVTYVLLEEPGEPVLLHWTGQQLTPHFRRDCPHCTADSTAELRSRWYIGGAARDGERVLVEFTERCFRSAAAAAARLEVGAELRELYAAPLAAGAVFTGLLVTISQAGPRRPRVLRCEQRVAVAAGAWPYRTREELARVWGVPVRPRLYREGDVG